MVRVSDENTSYTHPGGFVITEGSGAENVWSADTRKFYVIAEGGTPLAFGFDPLTMLISSFPGAAPGAGLKIPLRPGTFELHRSRSDLWNDQPGLSNDHQLPILDRHSVYGGGYDHVWNQSSAGSRSDLDRETDVSISADDSRFSISEGGPQFGKDMFIIVFDTRLGCRRY